MTEQEAFKALPALAKAKKGYGVFEFEHNHVPIKNNHSRVVISRDPYKECFTEFPSNHKELRDYLNGIVLGLGVQEFRQLISEYARSWLEKGDIKAWLYVKVWAANI